MKELITYEEAVKIAGEELVDAAEKENAVCCNFVTDGSEWTGYTPFASTVNNDMYRVQAVYLVTNEDAQEKDLDQIEWNIEGYSVEEI